MKAPLVLALFTALAFPAQQTFSPDAEGFIRNWLVLAPIAIDGESGATEIDRPYIYEEAKIKPKAGDKSMVGERPYTWIDHQTSDFFINFLTSFGQDRGEYVAAYAVAYVIADEAMKVTLALSSNDQGRGWLNGTEVFKFSDARALERDSEKSEVTLLKGQNVLVLKIINEVNDWQTCARFLQGTAPVKNIKISLTPQ